MTCDKIMTGIQTTKPQKRAELSPDVDASGLEENLLGHRETLGLE